MENNNGKTYQERYGFTASYVANLTLSKMSGSVDFSRSKVSQQVHNEEDADEVLAAFSVLDCYEEIARSMLKGTHSLRRKGGWDRFKVEELQVLRDAVKAFNNVVDEHIGERHRDERFSDNAG